ncbi:hypothetical protein [Escherichia coli]|uniref:hypothetical protein n=1 Tax=Escherichia coli TaxID=562 RepID=UPI00397EC9A4
MPVGEGPIEGPVKGLQSILVNKTPLTDTDGKSCDTRCDRGLARRGAGADTT